MVVNKLICILSIVFISSISSAWTLSSAEEERFEDKGVVSVLTFKEKGKAVEYRPSEFPYFMTMRKTYKLSENVEAIMTGWSYGARTVMYRVFDLNVDKKKPLCEIVSFSDEPEMRLKNKSVEIKVIESGAVGAKFSWEKCYNKK